MRIVLGWGEGEIVFKLCRELRDILLLGGGAGTGEGDGRGKGEGGAGEGEGGSRGRGTNVRITAAALQAVHVYLLRTTGFDAQEVSPSTLYSIIRMYIPCQVEQLQENLEPENTVRQHRGQVPGTWQAGVALGGQVKGRDLVVMACTLDMPLLTE